VDNFPIMSAPAARLRCRIRLDTTRARTPQFHAPKAGKG
jgi:hypothetical protein